METKNRVHAHARSASANLKRILTNNLAARQQEATRHQKMIAENKRQDEAHQREYKGMLRKAIQGTTNLVELHKTKELQKALKLLVQVHGPNYHFTIHEAEADYGGGFLAWRWTNCQIYMTPSAVMIYVQQVGQAAPGESELLYNLSDPCYDDGEQEITPSFQEVLSDLHHLYTEKPSWIVKSVKTTNFFEGKRGIPEAGLPVEWQRMSWFNFLIACSDEKKLASIMEKAFKNLDSGE
jgi:hypothetical protein